MNQLFIEIYYDFKEVQSQENLEEIVTNEKVKNNSVKMLKNFSPLVRVNVLHVKLIDLPKIIENLRSVEAVNMAVMRNSDFRHESCCEE